MAEAMTPSPSCLEHIHDLVAFDTTSNRSNLELIHYVADRLRQYGVAGEVVPGVEDGKANLFATIGPPGRPGVILSGHTDTVPADPAKWSSHPFKPEIRGSRLYGRGSADMKGFLGAVMAAVPRFQAAGLQRPVHIAFSHDEEVGCVGVRGLIDYIQERGLQPMACIVGEPTRMRPVLGHKGKLAIQVTVDGQAGHSSAAEGMNTIDVAAAIVGLIGKMREHIRRGRTGDDCFDPPFTTVQVGVIEGGQALNVRPARCRFAFEIRNLPGQDSGEILKAIQTHIEAAAVGGGSDEFTVTFAETVSFPPLAVEEDNPAWAFIRPLVDSQKTACVSFGTEAGLFQEAGIPSVVIGPGDIRQAHQPDEYIELEQIAACETFLSALCERLGQSGPVA